MGFQMVDDISRQILSTTDDVRASHQARAKSMAEKIWLDRLYRHFPEIARYVTDIQVDWPNRLPNTVIITLYNKQRYFYTSDPDYDHGALERI